MVRDKSKIRSSGCNAIRLGPATGAQLRDALGRPQSVLVLGGSSDIAFATAKEFGRRGARLLILAGRNPDAMTSTAEELRRLGINAVNVVEFDAQQVDKHESFIDTTFDRHGDIDVVLIAFGVLDDQKRLEQNHDAVIEAITTNYVGAVSVAVPLMRRLKAQGHGALVVLSSVAAERSRKSNFIYGSAKAGLDAFFQGLGDSLAGSGVTVLVVRPGWVRTKMTSGLKPAPLATTPDAVASAIVKALGRGAHTVWVPSLLRWVMAAVRHLPRPLFRKLEL